MQKYSCDEGLGCFDRDAQRAAERKIRFVRHLLVYAFVCTGVLITAGFKVMLIVAIFWGIGIVSQFFSVIVAPELRRQWIGTEVNRRVRKTVSRERRALEGRHVRSLEELAASIAHEIRNPVTAAKSLVQQMAEDPTGAPPLERLRGCMVSFTSTPALSRA